MASRHLVAARAYPRREAGPRSVTRIDRHSLILVIGLLALVAFAGVLYLLQASVAAQLRYRLYESEWQARDIWGRNFALRQEIADLERLSAVEERAARLGMIDAPAGPYIACTMPGTQFARSGQPAATQVQAGAEAAPTAGLWTLVAERLGWSRGAGALASAMVQRP